MNRALAANTINQQLAAVRRIAHEAADAGLLSPELAAGISRVRGSLDEIRFYGATSIQVMRRMKAVMNELISILPEERQPALRHWQERLQFTVERSFVDQLDKVDALAEDRQGLGSTRRGERVA